MISRQYHLLKSPTYRLFRKICINLNFYRFFLCLTYLVFSLHHIYHDKVIKTSFLLCSCQFAEPDKSRGFFRLGVPSQADSLFILALPISFVKRFLRNFRTFFGKILGFLSEFFSAWVFVPCGTQDIVASSLAIFLRKFPSPY